MRFEQDDLAFAAYVARHCPELEPTYIGGQLAKLRRLSVRYAYLCVRKCSEPGFGAKGEARLGNVGSDIQALAAQFEPAIRLVLDQEPRAKACVKFRLPDGRSNDMGGEEWCF